MGKLDSASLRVRDHNVKRIEVFSRCRLTGVHKRVYLGGLNKTSVVLNAIDWPEKPVV